MIENRVKWIDACKGLGIILVLLGYAPISRPLADYIFSFHMPLFFFISGYLLNVNKEKRIIEFIILKIRTLLIPYVSFSLISIILMSLINDTFVSSWSEFFRSMIISKRNEIFYNIPLWFLTTLFLIEILYFFGKKILEIQYIHTNYIGSI